MGGDLFKGYRPFLLGLLILSLYLSYLILRPFLPTIILSVILASFFYPVHGFFNRLYRGRKNASAFTTLMVIIILIVIPVLIFVSALIDQGIETVDRLNEWVRGGNIQRLMEHPKIVHLIAWLKKHLEFINISPDRLQTHLSEWSRNFGKFFLARGAALVGDLASMFFHFLVLVFISFYILRDGPEMVSGIKDLSPLREDQENSIIYRIKDTARSAVLGIFLTAMFQGMAGGIGLSIVGIPGIFWGTLMGFSSLIPMVGTALVWVPAVAYLLLLQKWGPAIFLAAWCILLVGSIDNFLRPFLMRGRERMSTFFIFLAIIGGITVFGLPGILYGPLILGFASIMLYIYRVEYSDLLSKEAEGSGKGSDKK